jgi:hypothetical protein
MTVAEWISLIAIVVGGGSVFTVFTAIANATPHARTRARVSHSIELLNGMKALVTEPNDKLDPPVDASIARDANSLKQRAFNDTYHTLLENTAGDIEDYASVEYVSTDARDDRFANYATLAMSFVLLALLATLIIMHADIAAILWTLGVGILYLVFLGFSPRIYRRLVS